MRKIFALLLFILPACSALEGNKEVSGTLRMGHEVRSFTDNEDNKEYWLIDKSDNLMKAYNEAIKPQIAKYQPLQARLKVKDLGKIQEGFGAEYDGTYEVQEIISIHQ